MDPDNNPAEQLPTEAPPQETAEVKADAIEAPEAAEKDAEEQAKPEKTPEQREIERLRRGIDRRTRRLAETEARLRDIESRLQSGDSGATNRTEQDDSETITLSRAEVAVMVKREAERLASTLKQQDAEIEHRRGIVVGLAKEWGQARFDAIAAELDEALGGLAVNGKIKPATDAIFAADKPAKVIEYLADPEHADDAEKLAGMSAVHAGRFVARIEAQLEAKAKEAKPQRSNAPAPIEKVSGQGNTKSMPDPRNVHAWIQEMNRRERAGQL